MPISGTRTAIPLEEVRLSTWTAVKVGDAAQTSFGLLGTYKIIKGLSVDLDYRYYDRLYAAIDPDSFDTPDNDGSLQLPSFGLLDGGISYNIYLQGAKKPGDSGLMPTIC